MRKLVICTLTLFFLVMTSTFAETTSNDANKAENLRVITENFAPFNFKTEAGKITGRSTEVVKEIMSRLNLDIEIELMAWSEGYECAQNNQNVALYSTARTPEREDLFKWVGPIASDEFIFYALKDSNLKLHSLEDAEKVNAVAVVKESSRHQLLQQEKLNNLKLFSSDVECYQALAKGEVALVLGSSMTKDDMCKEAGVEPSQVKPEYFLKKIPYYIAFNKKTSDKIVKQWQAALNKMKNDGSYKAILKKWNGSVTPSYPELSAKNAIPINSTLQLLTNYIDESIIEFLEILQALTYTNEVRTEAWQDMKTILIAREKMAPAGRIWYMRPDGSYYTTVDDLTSKNLKDRSYFPSLMAGNSINGDLVVSKSTGRTVAVVAAPITGKGGEVKGALGTSIYMQNVNAKIEQVFPLPRSLKFFAVTEKGEIALHSNEAFVGLHITTMDVKLADIRKVKEGEANFSYNGEKWKATWTTAPKTKWRIVIATKAD